MVQTAASSALGITFSDGTTFNLKANAQITIDNFVYEDGGKNNAGVFDVAKGTVLYRIDPTIYEAALRSAEGTLANAQARLANAQRHVNRV